MVASSAGARTAPRFLRLSESWRRTQETAFKEITRSAPAEKRPHGDDGWGEFVRSPDPAAEKRRGRRLDCSSLSFLFHHEAAGGRPRREARAPCDVISQSAKERQHQVIGLELDIGRDREGDLRWKRGNERDAPISAIGVRSVLIKDVARGSNPIGFNRGAAGAGLALIAGPNLSTQRRIVS